MTTTPGKLEYPSDKGHIDDGKTISTSFVEYERRATCAHSRGFVPRPKAGNFQPLLSLPVRHP